MDFIIYIRQNKTMNLEIWQQAGNYFDFESHKIFYRLSKQSDEIFLCLARFSDFFLRLS